MISARKPIRDPALLCAVMLGLLADQLVRVPGRPGLNVALWALSGGVVLWLLSRRRDVPVSIETRSLVGGAVVFAGLLVLRDAEALAVFSLFSAVVLLGLAAGRGAFAWATRMHFVELAVSTVRVGVLIALGPFGWNIGGARQPTAVAPMHRRVWQQRARIAARGTVMALPPLIVLTALLASADPVFERVLRNALFVRIEPLLEHVAFAGLIAWFTSGYLRAFFVSDDAGAPSQPERSGADAARPDQRGATVMDRVSLPRPALPPSEITVALSLLNVLFLVFLAVQVRYLFGGSALVEVTEGLSYADYARRGFFELVAAAALVVPVLLVADWAAAENGVRGRRALRATSTLLVLLLKRRARIRRVSYAAVSGRLRPD